MATDNNTQTHTPAQTARNDRDQQNEHEKSVRERQHRAEAERRREKRWERWRVRETAIARRVNIHQPGPQQDARDHRGEVV
ncbi:MAG TPA: hypothetical protein VFJ06_07960 [Halococcus sp.]|nr:hypothetical protein [Halococcus sp.]